ncbi:vWA domain-containing protein [Piscinibacter sakaiensis]
MERTGTGAEIMLVLDRSRSMDQGFAGAGQAPPPKGTGPEALSYYVQLQQRRNQSSKGQVARTLLGEFAARRPDDRFAMVVFSTRAMPVLDFTQKRDAVQAAIAAGNIGRGLSETDIGQALQSALAAFEDRPYTGSRIVLLVSDGGDHLDPDVRRLLGEQMRRLRVSLYWIYIRSAASPGLMRDGIEAAHADTVPEHFLDRWFASIGVPYRAYEAEDGAALQRAIDDVDRLENLPIVYTDMLPRREFTPWALGVALAAVLLGRLTPRCRRPPPPPWCRHRSPACRPMRCARRPGPRCSRAAARARCCCCSPPCWPSAAGTPGAGSRRARRTPASRRTGPIPAWPATLRSGRRRSASRTRASSRRPASWRPR